MKEHHINSKEDFEKKYNDLLKRVAQLQAEKTKFEVVVQQNGLLDEVSKISDVEVICIEQIKRLKEKSADGNFVEADAKVLDLLHKNLRMARGQVIEKDSSKKTKNLSIDQLMKIYDEVQ